MTTSSLRIMPRSPWAASAGWMKIAGVPQLASVAASLRPTRPDLPMPSTMTRVLVRQRSSTARANSSPRPRLRSVTAFPSSRRTARPVSMICFLVMGAPGSSFAGPDRGPDPKKGRQEAFQIF